MLGVLIVLAIAYVWLCVIAARAYKRKAATYGIARRLAEKPLVLSLAYGWGFIATPGFGLPAPIIWCFVFNQPYYLHVNALYPWLFWVGVFFVVELLMIVLERAYGNK